MRFLVGGTRVFLAIHFSAGEFYLINPCLLEKVSLPDQPKWADHVTQM
jgi:hypothetical protein